MSLTIIYLVAVILVGIISIAAFFIAIDALIEVKSLQKSTHTIVQTMTPIDSDDIHEDYSEEIDKVIERSEDIYSGMRAQDDEYNDI